MATEQRSRRYSGLDDWEPSDILDVFIEGQLAAVAAVRAVRREIKEAVLAMEERLKGGSGRLVYAGAGTSGRLAVQDGAELTPTFSWPSDRLVLLIAGGDEALLQAVEGAEDEAERGGGGGGGDRGGPRRGVVRRGAGGATPVPRGGPRRGKTRWGAAPGGA